MAAGILLVAGWTPAVDSDGAPIPNARAYYYLDETTTLAPIFADEGLTTPLTNPVEANSSGRWPIIWASDANTYTWSIEAPYGPPGLPFTGTGLTASQATDLIILEGVNAAADQADDAADLALDAYNDILALAASLPDTDPVVIAGKANVNGSNILGANQAAFRGAIGAVGSVALAAGTGGTLVGSQAQWTDAIAETAEARLDRLPIYPETFGGTVANQMTKALAAAQATGGTIQLAPGASYAFTSWTPVTTSLPVTIRGDGTNTLTGPASPVSFLNPGSSVNIQGVNFSGWLAVLDTGAVSGTIDRLSFRQNKVNACSVAIAIERPVNRYWIEDNAFEATTGGYTIRIGTNVYASQDTWQRGNVLNNTFKDITASGTSSCAAMLIYGRDVLIQGNTIDGVSQSGTGEAWGIYTKVRYCTISGNHIRNVDAMGNADILGITIKGATRAVTSSPQGYNVICVNNHIRNIGLNATRGTGIRGQTDDCLIGWNQLEDTGVNGIVADDSSGYRNFIICNNSVMSQTTPILTAGFRLNGAGKRVLLKDNIVDGCVAGLVLQSTASPGFADLKIEGNIFSVTVVGIELSAFENIARMKIAENIFGASTYAILDNANAGVISNAVVRNNDMTQPGNKISGPFAASTRVYENEGYLSNTATYNPNSLVDGAGETTAVAVNGAILGDQALATFSLDLQGILFTSWVSAANTVSVRFQNETGGTIDLASGTIKAWTQRT